MSTGVSLRRFLPAAVGATLFFIMSALWLTGNHTVYEAFLLALGVEPFRLPFVDTHAVLSAIQCHRLGIDVYEMNPCDVLGRPHVYSPLWLYLDIFPVATSWTTPIGLALDLAFIASLTMLPPARQLAGALVIAVAVASPSVAYALERANIDLLIFLLATLACWLSMRSARIRPFGIAVGVLAAGLKFYPATILILAWRERWQRCLLLLALAVLILATYAFFERVDIVRAMRLVPRTDYGAFRMPFGIAVKMGWPDWSRSWIQAGLMLLMAAGAWRWSHRLQPALLGVTEAERVFLTVGAILCLGCFVTGPSNGYRSILFLFVLPAMVGLATKAGDCLSRTAVGLVVAVMWSDAVRLIPGSLGQVLRLIDQSIWWVVMTILSAMLLALLRQSLAWISLLEQLQIRRSASGR